ncbi:RagB/SusD family nutrient uptake outer membrane protein [Flavihumibacter profundi]|jgi:starch-binding outer membrane protein, SusD/RagB family|uniref:RagB/SusD family nutrient uptake outer membrane protein n=1 Tax=Flavihumibacter profundi TaxID=2716883 RepID=UPI001CC4B0D4|nr:RagB/SusD family nutrient uptake outer membrane protein [Flavihumibacter profundi]MBZ5858655.1 RagB/SusD family nutrient uptake outer membrane protein [Flavihumibacter profundi]
MSNNRFKIIGILFIALALFSACTKGLTKNPYASIDESQALLTSSDVESALVGTYAQLCKGYVYGGDIFVYSELLGDDGNIAWSGTYQGMTQIFNKNIPVNNDFVEGTWLASYNTINVANNVLSALDKVTEANRNRVEGGAKFIRGSLLFDLVRLYAKPWNDGSPASNDGVPIILTPTRSITEASYVARNKVSEVYTQVIKDLTEAESLLPADNSFFANKSAAAGMLARVYLQQGDYANAASAADRVINSGSNSLTSDYASAFPYNPNNPNQVVGNTTEDVFAMQVNTTQGVNDFATFFSQAGRGDIEIVPSYFSDYEQNDQRPSQAFYQASGSIYCGKFDMLYGAVHIIRLAEMYLIRGESNFRLAPASPIGGVPAVDDINTIRERAGLAPIADNALTLDKIILERSHELSFEGFKLHDAKRLQKSILGIAWNDPHLIFPIPDREIKVNKNLTQNAGY